MQHVDVHAYWCLHIIQPNCFKDSWYPSLIRTKNVKQILLFKKSIYINISNYESTNKSEKYHKQNTSLTGNTGKKSLSSFNFLLCMKQRQGLPNSSRICKNKEKMKKCKKQKQQTSNAALLTASIHVAKIERKTNTVHSPFFFLYKFTTQRYPHP